MPYKDPEVGRQRNRERERSRRKRLAPKIRIRGSPEYWVVRERNWKKRGNPMTKELYLKLHTEQGGKCGLCGKPETVLYGLSADHNHAKDYKKSRGLTCAHCNRKVIGNNFDYPRYIQGIVRYLFRWEPGALTGVSFCPVT